MRSPNYDLEDPRVQALFKAWEQRVLLAHEAVTRVQDAVRPLYTYDLGAGGGRLPRRPRQHASGVLVKLDDQVFVFSVAHGFECYDGYPIVVGCGDRLFSFNGDRYSSVQGASGTHQDDPVDAAVFHIAGEVPPVIREAAIGWESIDTSEPGTTDEVHVAIGFRAKASRVRENVVSSHQDVWSFAEYDEAGYTAISVDRSRFLALPWNNQLVSGGQWQTAPRPAGMSGGALIRIEGLGSDPFQPPSLPLTARLSATLSECRIPKGVKPGALLGPRVGLHVGLIVKYNPRLKSWIEARLNG